VTNRRSQAAVSAVEFIDKRIKLDEKGEPFTLAPYQRRVLEMLLRRDPSGELPFRLVLLSEPKIHCRIFRHRVERFGGKCQMLCVCW
jgi:hypothetical protein